MEKKDILSSFSLDESTKREIMEYTENKFDTNVNIPEKIEDEPFVAQWRCVLRASEKEGIEKALNENLAHGDEDIKLISPELTTLEIYDSIAGNIPVIYSKEEEDFYQLVTKLINKGKEMPNIRRTGASFAFGSSNKFIILSNKPYSNIPADMLDLSDDKWKDYSLIIRREHECTHYFTNRFLGATRNNLHDELVADFAGIVCATNNYYAKWFLLGMGLGENNADESPMPGRFPVYVPNLSEKAKYIMKTILIKASKNVETWYNETGKNMSRNGMVVYLCSKSLLELYSLYD